MTTNHIEKFWVPATSDHVARVMAGEVVEARFRDHAKGEWESSTLEGWQGHLPYKWIKATGSPYCECQVYSPPQYWLDRPEPGEGYRLLAKFPDEPVRGGDFIRNTSGGWTELANGCNPAQAERIWYRRKIEQPKPEPKYAVGQRVRIIGPKERPAANWDRAMDKHIGAVADVVSVSSVVGDKVFYDLRFIEQWAFLGDYLEPVAEPKHYVLQVGDTVSTPSGRQAIVTELGIEVS